MKGTPLASGPLVRSGTAALASVSVGQFRKLSGPPASGAAVTTSADAPSFQGGVSAAGLDRASRILPASCRSPPSKRSLRPDTSRQPGTDVGPRPNTLTGGHTQAAVPGSPRSSMVRPITVPRPPARNNDPELKRHRECHRCGDDECRKRESDAHIKSRVSKEIGRAGHRRRAGDCAGEPGHDGVETCRYDSEDRRLKQDDDPDQEDGRTPNNCAPGSWSQLSAIMSTTAPLIATTPRLSRNMADGRFDITTSSCCRRRGSARRWATPQERPRRPRPWRPRGERSERDRR